MPDANVTQGHSAASQIVVPGEKPEGEAGHSPGTIDFEIAAPCPCCGQPRVRLLACACTHLSVFHEIRSNGTRGKCAAGAGLTACDCTGFQEGGP